MYECKAWSLTPLGYSKFRLFENKIQDNVRTREMGMANTTQCRNYDRPVETLKSLKLIYYLIRVKQAYIGLTEAMDKTEGKRTADHGIGRCIMLDWTWAV